jgi:hypothetical protein
MKGTMKTIKCAHDLLTRQTLTAGSIILTSFMRTFKGTLGLWCIVGPLLPFAIFESDRIAAILLSVSAAVVIYGLIVWKIRTGSAATIASIFRDAGLALVFSLVGGIAVAVLFGVNIGGAVPFVIWGCFFILEWRNRLAAPWATKAA